MKDFALCECGCGENAPVATKTSRAQGYVKGEPMRFVNGHQHHGSNNGRWKGGIKTDKHGYVLVWMPDHPEANNTGCVRQHRLIAEKALGRLLPGKAVVHHHNEDPVDNRPENLVVCQDNAYHMLLHQRMRALRACGNANWVRCRSCKRYDDPSRMYVPSVAGRSAVHRECQNRDARERRKAA